MTGATAREARGIYVVAVVIALLAGAEALAGLVAAGLRVEPLAERIEGSWRPGGSFEYPPALALLQLSALPVLLAGMAARRRSVAVAAGAGAALAGAVIALAAGRLEIVLGLGLLAVPIAWPAMTMGISRRTAIAAAAVPILAGIGARLVAGGYAYPGGAADQRSLSPFAWRAQPQSPRGGSCNLAPHAFAAAFWSPWGPKSPSERDGEWPRTGRHRRLPPSLLFGASVLALAVVAALALGSSGKWTEPSSGFSHGRVDEWRAAARTALDHPLTGAGAQAYGVASVDHQPQPAGLYAHDLPLETWAELGPLGLALICGLYVSVGTLCWRIRRRPGAWLVVPGALVFRSRTSIDWPWHLARPSRRPGRSHVGGCRASSRSARPLIRG